MPPAARITDAHTCPAHGGGPVVTGFATVIIGYQPAARATDKAVCPAPDAIAAGSSNVIIGYQQAARLGDPTVHGGVVATGFPTVLIGTTAQSAALSGAAGVPFCEECERARREAQERAQREQAGDGDEEPAAAAAPEEQPAAEPPASADEPTEEEVAQASAPGNTLEQRAAREKVVRDFYEKSGLGSARADVDLGVGGVPPRPNLHPLGFGIDLSRPLGVVKLPETLAQVVPAGALPGNVFDPRGTPLGDAINLGKSLASGKLPNLGALPGELLSSGISPDLGKLPNLGALPKLENAVNFALPAGVGLLSTSGPGAGRTPGLPQITVPDGVLRLAVPQPFKPGR